MLRLFNCQRDLTMYAEDEPMLYTIHDAVSFSGKAPYPVWDMDAVEITTQSHIWRVAGYWESTGRSFVRHGFHIPDDVALAMRDWLNQYVQQYQRAQVIPRSQGKSGRAVMCTYAEIAGIIQSYSPR